MDLESIFWEMPFLLSLCNSQYLILINRSIYWLTIVVCILFWYRSIKSPHTSWVSKVIPWKECKGLIWSGAAAKKKILLKGFSKLMPVCILSRFCSVWLFATKDCSPTGSSVLEILQARILEWAAISSSGGSSWPKDRTLISDISCIGRQALYH